MKKHLLCAVLMAVTLYYVSTSPVFRHDSAHQRTVALAVTAGAVLLAYGLLWALARSLRSRREPRRQPSGWNPR